MSVWYTKGMKIEIDQSGKVEETARRTAIGDSLGNVVVMSAADKKAIQALYRSIGQPRSFVIQLFSLLVTFVIARSVSETHTYTIDPEYPGKEEEILTWISYFAHKLSLPFVPDHVVFHRVGKSSLAHGVAHKAFKKKQTPATVSALEAIRYLLPQKMDRAL